MKKTRRFHRTPIAAAILSAFAAPAMPALAQEEPSEIAATELPEFEVTGHTPEPGYTPDQSHVGGKVPAPVRDIPQTVNIVNRAVLDAQNATTLTDALRNVPGITMTSGEGGQIGDNVNLRGFTARTDVYLDGMRDRGQYKRDTFWLESVEVLKGPSSLFFGRGSTGGVVNQVSKQPGFESKNSLSLSLGTDEYYRTTMDFNQPLSSDAAVRVAAMGQKIGSTRDVVENKDWGVAPALRLKLGKDTDLSVSGLVQRNRDVPDYGIPVLGPAPAPVGHDRFYGDSDDYFDQDANIGRVRIEHRLSPALTLRNQFQGYVTETNARPTPYRVCTPAFDNAGSAPTAPCPVAQQGASLDQITVQSDRRDRELDDRSLFDQLDLVARFDTGPISHTMVGGVEAGRDDTQNQAYTWSTRWTQNLGGFVPQPTPDGITRAQAPTHTEGTATTLALYVNDTISLTPDWKLVAGVRRDRFDAQADTITNADGTATQLKRTDYGTGLRGGVIWQPDSEQSYYASYGSSFNPSAEAITISATQALVSPEKTRSYEVGGKWDLLGGDLSLSSALFRVDKTDARTTSETGVVSLDGDTRVQGFEIGAVGRVTRAWSLIGGYTFLDSELVSTNDGTGTGENRVSFRGNELPNTPRHAGSLWSTYRFLQHFEAGGGAYYVGERYMTTANVSSVDSYWRADALLAWHQPVFDVQLNVQNVLDEDYYDAVVQSEGGRSVPGRGRTVVGTFTYRFKI